MASSLPPVKGAAFSFETALVSQADTDIFKAGPTLAAGDVKVIKDGTYDDNIDTLPSAVTSCTNVITVALSATEMNADRVTVILHDASGNEWQDQVITIFTTGQTLDTTDGIADDIKATVNHADYGNAKLVRSTTPANTLTVDASHRALSDLASILGTALTETAGQIAAAFKKLFDVATPVMTTESVNQTGDSHAIVNHVTYGNSALETLVDDLETRLGTPSDLGSGATVAANLVDIEGQTDDIGVAGAGLTAVKLAADGLDAISTTAPAGAASNFREMMVAVWRRLFKKVTLTSSEMKTYDDAGTSVVTTQALTDDGTTQTQGAAS